MAVARIRNGELTIPLSVDIREKLGVKDGEEVNAIVFNGRLMIVRASEEARRAAGERLMEIIDQVRLQPGQQPLTEDEIVEEVKAVRRARRKLTAHD